MKFSVLKAFCLPKVRPIIAYLDNLIAARQFELGVRIELTKLAALSLGLKAFLLTAQFLHRVDLTVYLRPPNCSFD